MTTDVTCKNQYKNKRFAPKTICSSVVTRKVNAYTCKEQLLAHGGQGGLELDKDKARRDVARG